MRFPALICVLATGLHGLAAVVPSASSSSPGFLAVDLQLTTIPASALHARRALSQPRRSHHPVHARAAADTSAVDLPETDLLDLTNAYLAEVALGSPTPQPLNLIVDTGSSWLWTNPSCEWARNQRLCLQFPRYDPSRSVPPPARVPELDGFQGYASGDWASLFGYADTLWLEGWSGSSGRAATKIEGQAVGVANETDGSFTGFLGLGPDLQTGFDSKVANYSVLNNLVKNGAIASRTFGIGLEKVLTFNLRSEKSLVFGGVDKNKYGGKFMRLPVQLPGKGGGDEYYRFWVNVLGVTHTPADGVARPRLSFGSGRNTSYIVDTGTTGIYLPREVVSSIMSDLKLSWRPGAFPSIPCSRARENGTLAFEFLDKWEAIKVPYSTLVLENTPGSCLFLITSVESEAIDLHILGLGFLRAAYTVFDWDNKDVYLAQRADCGNGTDIVAIPAGAGAASAIEGNCR